MLLIAGVADARNIACDGGDCRGTIKSDTTNGSHRDDKMDGEDRAGTPCSARATTRSRAATAKTGSMAAKPTTTPGTS